MYSAVLSGRLRDKLVCPTNPSEREPVCLRDSTRLDTGLTGTDKAITARTINIILLQKLDTRMKMYWLSSASTLTNLLDTGPHLAWFS